MSRANIFLVSFGCLCAVLFMLGFVPKIIDREAQGQPVVGEFKSDGDAKSLIKQVSIKKKNLETLEGIISDSGGAEAVASNSRSPTALTRSYSKEQKLQRINTEGGYLAPFNQIFKKYQREPTGMGARKIASLLEFCAGVLLSEETMEAEMESIEQTFLEAGMSNGDIQQAHERTRRRHEDCRAIDAQVSVMEFYDFAVEGARLGDQRAQIDIATLHTLPGFEGLNQEAQRQHKLKMGKHLSNASEQCNPRAFLAISNHGAEWDSGQWEFVGGPKQVAKLASALTAYRIYKDHYLDAEKFGLLSKATTQIERLVKNVKNMEIAAAISARQYLNSCSNE